MKPNSDPPMQSTLQPYSSYKPTPNPWVGQIPQHWQSAPGKAVYLTKQMINVGMRESTVLSLSYGRLRIRDEAELHGLVPASFETYQIIQPGDIVCRPTDLQNDWNSLRFGHSNFKGIITSAYLCLQTRPGIDPRYGHLLLHAYDLKKVFYGLGSGLRQNLDWSDFKYLQCLIPTLEEQAAIVRCLDHADELINRYISAKERLIALLEEQRQAIINQAVTRGIDPKVNLKPSGAHWLGDVPEHWKMCRSKRLFSPRREFARPHDIQLSATQAFGVIPQDDYEQRVGRKVVKVSLHLDKRLHVEVDDFVISMRSFQGGLERAWSTGCIRSSYVILRPTSDVDVGFFTYLFKSQAYIQAIQSTGDFIRDGQDLNFNNFCAVDLPLPPAQEQGQIAAALQIATDNIDTNISGMRRQIHLMREYRTRLITDVVTGQLDVRDATVELPD